jgi:hypothetical protein
LKTPARQTTRHRPAELPQTNNRHSSNHCFDPRSF